MIIIKGLGAVDHLVPYLLSCTNHQILLLWAFPCILRCLLLYQQRILCSRALFQSLNVPVCLLGPTTFSETFEQVNQSVNQSTSFQALGL